MHSVLNRPRPAGAKPAAWPMADRPPRVSGELGENLDRMQTEEQIERDRRQEQELRDVREELAKHD